MQSSLGNKVVPDADTTPHTEGGVVPPAVVVRGHADSRCRGLTIFTVEPRGGAGGTRGFASAAASDGRLPPLLSRTTTRIVRPPSVLAAGTDAGSAFVPGQHHPQLDSRALGSRFDGATAGAAAHELRGTVFAGAEVHPDTVGAMGDDHVVPPSPRSPHANVEVASSSTASAVGTAGSAAGTLSQTNTVVLREASASGADAESGSGDLRIEAAREAARDPLSGLFTANLWKTVHDAEIKLRICARYSRVNTSITINPATSLAYQEFARACDEFNRSQNQDPKEKVPVIECLAGWLSRDKKPGRLYLTKQVNPDRTPSGCIVICCEMEGLDSVMRAKLQKVFENFIALFPQPMGSVDPSLSGINFAALSPSASNVTNIHEASLSSVFEACQRTSQLIELWRTFKRENMPDVTYPNPTGFKRGVPTSVSPGFLSGVVGPSAGPSVPPAGGPPLPSGTMRRLPTSLGTVVAAPSTSMSMRFS